MEFIESINAVQNILKTDEIKKTEMHIEDEKFESEQEISEIPSEDEESYKSDFDEEDAETIEHESRVKGGETMISSVDFICMYCKDSYNSYDSLVDHLSSRVCQSNNCKICNRTFDDVRKFKAHMYNHKKTEEEQLKRKEKRLVCEECGKVFTNTFSLKCHIEAMHRRVEREDIVFKCNYCDQKFKAHMDLVEHNKIHRTKCEHCGKVFESRRRMVAHRTQVHGEKKIVCEVCGKAYRSKLLLHQHMHIHTGIKTFVCEYCPDNKAYAKLTSLRKHQKKLHFDEMNQLNEEHN